MINLLNQKLSWYKQLEIDEYGKRGFDNSVVMSCRFVNTFKQIVDNQGKQANITAQVQIKSKDVNIGDKIEYNNKSYKVFSKSEWRNKASYFGTLLYCVDEIL
jgi:hypothetical protein